MRFFRATPQITLAVWQQAKDALGHPNGRADQPFNPTGDFEVGGYCYLGLGPHHTEGPFWGPMIDAAIAAGVEEITRAEYMAARPAVEELI